MQRQIGRLTAAIQRLPRISHRVPQGLAQCGNPMLRLRGSGGAFPRCGSASTQKQPAGRVCVDIPEAAQRAGFGGLTAAGWRLLRRNAGDKEKGIRGGGTQMHFADLCARHSRGRWPGRSAPAHPSALRASGPLLRPLCGLALDSPRTDPGCPKGRFAAQFTPYGRGSFCETDGMTHTGCFANGPRDDYRH